MEEWQPKFPTVSNMKRQEQHNECKKIFHDGICVCFRENTRLRVKEKSYGNGAIDCARNKDRHRDIEESRKWKTIKKRSCWVKSCKRGNYHINYRELILLEQDRRLSRLSFCTLILPSATEKNTIKLLFFFIVIVTTQKISYDNDECSFRSFDSKSSRIIR